MVQFCPSEVMYYQAGQGTKGNAGRLQRHWVRRKGPSSRVAGVTRLRAAEHYLLEDVIFYLWIITC